MMATVQYLNFKFIIKRHKVSIFIHQSKKSVVYYFIFLYQHLETWSLMQKHLTRGDSNWSELHTLSPASHYNLRVVAVNLVGTSHPSRVIEVATKEEVPEGPPLDVEALANTSQSLIISWKVS